MPEYVRARDKSTGHQHSILTQQSEGDGWEVLKDREATYADGTPLPPKFKVSVSSEAEKKTGGQTADPKEK